MEDDSPGCSRSSFIWADRGIQIGQRMSKISQIGLLWDSISDNMGDHAIGLVLQRALNAHGLPTRIVDPFTPLHHDLAMLVVGGGELIRTPGDPFYDAFRVPGKHILNTVGVLDGTGTEYLADYRMVTSRSRSDHARLSRGEVYPDLALLFGDYLSSESTSLAVDIPNDALGIHVMPSQPEGLLVFADWLRKVDVGPIVWLPVTHYANDEALMRMLAGHVPGSVLLPKLSPDDIFRVIGCLRLLVTSSFHGMLFAYAQDVPFISIQQSAKLGYFLNERRLQAHMAQTAGDLPELLPRWLHTPPPVDTPRALDQARCRELVERISIHADEALRKMESITSIHLPQTNRRFYDEQMHWRRKEGAYVADCISLRIALKSRDEEIKKLHSSVENFHWRIAGMAAENGGIGGSRQAKRLRNAPTRPAMMLFVKELIREAVGSIFASRRSASKMIASSQLVFGIETDLTEPVYIGEGVSFPLQGWCYSQESLIRRLEILINGIPHRVEDHSGVRLDIFENQVGEADQSGNSLVSGFRTMLPFAAIKTPEHVRLSLRAELEDHSVAEQSIGSLQLLPGAGMQPVSVQWPSAAKRVAICMTTYNPLPDLFRKQIESIQNQTHTNWICIISDDASSVAVRREIRDAIKGDDRFVFMENEKRLGFYLNYERCLRFAPADADFIALSDHDDNWFPDKLEALIAEFRDNTQLVYSDMHVVSRAGETLSKTFWITRKNNYRDLATLLFANTITGAASLFRSSLLPILLPFPKRMNDAFHDHWLALTAMVKGEIRFIKRPLYGYCQHNANVHGHRNEEKYPGPLRDLKGLVFAGRSLTRLQRAGQRILGDAVQCYPHILHKIILAKTLLLRQPHTTSGKKRILNRIARIECSLMPLIIEQVRAVVSRRPSLGLEWLHLKIAAGVRLSDIYYRSQKDRLYLKRIRKA
jgi:glycosyltransferase involved in cell wall biosynthesis